MTKKKLLILTILMIILLQIIMPLKSLAVDTWHTITLHAVSSGVYSESINNMTAKVKVGDKVGKGNYEVSSVSGTTIKLKVWGDYGDEFYIPNSSDLWNEARRSDSVTWYGVDDPEKREGSLVRLPLTDAIASYYFNTSASASIVDLPQSYIWNFTLKFDANGGTGAPNMQKYGTSGKYEKSHFFTIPADVPTRSGYKFAGWAESANSSAIKQPGQSYYVIQTVSGYNGGSIEKTLYAVWKQYNYTLKYKSNEYNVTNIPSENKKTCRR